MCGGIVDNFMLDDDDKPKRKDRNNYPDSEELEDEEDRYDSKGGENVSTCNS